ncbi:MAG TPA: ABC transporter substrate-binding protein [Pseudolysinimonas sp.]|nr:ABC transporter substrate-binding protein [Pseudolysinimonas sp.]
MHLSFSRKRGAVAASLLVTVGLLAGCTTTSGGSGEKVPGVTAKTISLGVISPLTGIFAAGGKAQLAGVNLYWDEVNANGGVCDGRKVKIIARDHAYDPQKAVTAYSGIRKDILGVQLLTGTPMTEAVAPQMEQDNVVVIPQSWSPTLLGKKLILIPGTPFDVEMVNAVDYLVDKKTLKKGDSIGYIYFQGDFGGSGLKGATYAAEQHGITVDPYQIDPTVTDLSSQINQIAAKGNKAIFMSASPPQLANAAALSATAGLDIPIIAPTPTYVPQLLSSPAADQIADRVLVVSPYNAWSAKDKAVSALRTLYEGGDKSAAEPQQLIIAGYASGLLMKTALDDACKKGELTRASLAAAFADVESFDMQGLSVNLTYPKDRSSAPPGFTTYIHKADKAAVGGLTPLVKQPYEGEDAKAYFDSEK